MGSRGVHFALTAAEEQRLLLAAGDDAVMAVIVDVEEAWDATRLAETDKAWDAIHRCLGDGTLQGDGGDPLVRAVLGGRQLHEGDDYIVSYVSATDVRDVAAALAPITRAWLRARYDTLDPDDYAGPIGDEDFEYTWENFEDLRELYGTAAASGLAVVFTVDP